MLVRLAGRASVSVVDALIALIALARRLPQDLMQTLTWDCESKEWPRRWPGIAASHWLPM